MLLISCHIFYTYHFLLGFMSAITLEADTGKLCVPEGTIFVRDSDLCLLIPEGIVTVQDSDLCHMLSVPEGTITVRDSDLCLLW